ncbi:hypothetical protein CPB97_001658, partial [Podila verticillata]
EEDEDGNKGDAEDDETTEPGEKNEGSTKDKEAGNSEAPQDRLEGDKTNNNNLGEHSPSKSPNKPGQPLTSDPNTDAKAKLPPAPQATHSTNSSFIDGSNNNKNMTSNPVPVPDLGGNNNKALAPPSPPDDKESGTKIITYTLIPLTLIAGAIYGVVAYRRRIRRRAALRRAQEDDEAAALEASRPGRGGDSNDDAASVFSDVSYRPPAPFTSTVDVTTEGLEQTQGRDDSIVVGPATPHQIGAPKRDEARVGDYQDYSHVCQAQMLGKTCTNHSISCFVALNHSNAGLEATAAAREPVERANGMRGLEMGASSSSEVVETSYYAMLWV